MAALWKGILSQDFIDGTFFHYAFLTDARFADISRILAHTTTTMFQENTLAIGKLAFSAGATEEVLLKSTPRMPFVSVAIAIWTLVIEAALGLCFLWPKGHGLSRWRNLVLLIFAWSTYMVATVETFGWILMILGASQCDPEEKNWRLAFIFTCPLLLLYDQVAFLSFLPKL